MNVFIKKSNVYLPIPFLVYQKFLFIQTIKDCFLQFQEGACDGGRGSGRENANNVDLNRNFPDQWRDWKSKDLTTGKEPETIAAMTWIVTNPFVLSGNLHGGSVVASYPFDDSR